MATEDIGNEVQLVVFNLGTEEYGVDITQVREIVKVSNITKIPNSPSFIEGVINLRGQITTVMDLRKRLNVGTPDVTDDTRIIIIELEKSTVGMMVDSVTEVQRLPEKSIDSTPSISMEVGTEYIMGVGKLDDRLLILLDLKKILSGKEENQLEEI